MRSSPSLRWWLVPALVLVAACFGDAEPVETTLPPQMEPVDVVDALLTALHAGRFEDTPAFTDVEQASLASLAEGADATDRVEALDADPHAGAASVGAGLAHAP